MGFFDVFRKKSQRTSPASKGEVHAGSGDARPVDRVEFDDERVVHHRSDGNVEAVAWAELEEVGILTTDDGPFAEDVFWMLLASGGHSGCAIPSDADGMKLLLGKLQALPGFDNGKVIEAMGSAVDARFVCWRRNAG
jgi:hypothetical protein